MLQIAVPASLHLLRPPGQRVQDGGAQGEEDCLVPHQRKFRGNVPLLFVTNNRKDLSNTSYHKACIDTSSIPRKVVKWLVVNGVFNSYTKGDIAAMRLFLHM